MARQASTVAGAFATQRFQARRRAWWRRIWWTLPPFAVFLVAVPVVLGRVLAPEHMTFYWGAGLGLAFGVVVALADSPPHHIERWRQGAQGEKATAKALRPLVRRGWTLVNDIDTGRGNLDHVLVGPPGVFLLESKNLSGVLAVAAGVLSVRWREEPDDGYENRRLARQMRNRAQELERQLQRHGVEVSVQPLVVLWGDFPQGSVLNKRTGVAWVDGEQLQRVLRERPVRLGADERRRASHALVACWPPDRA
jgi:hypothetical protein